MSLTQRQEDSRQAWQKAKHDYQIAAKGERDRTAKHLACAALDVLRADIAARNEARDAA